MKIKELQNILKNTGPEEKNVLIERMAELCSDDVMDMIISEVKQKYGDTLFNY